jgi:excisionase family DNA binding protein
LPLLLRVQQDWKMKTRLNEYVKVAEAAEILGVSQGTVRAWAEGGKIPMHKNPANGYRLFKRTELENFLAEIEKTVPAPPPSPR